MKRSFSFIKKLLGSIVDWFAKMDLLRFAILSFVIVSINFLPLISKLGFYLDDWPQVYSWTVHGFEGIKQYWIADSRWFTWWIQSALFPVLGAKPLYWHILMVFLRWATSILVWLILKRIWPRQIIAITVTALLFGIYPLFAQQSSAVMFSVIWVCFALYLLSLLLMVQAYDSKKWFVFFTFTGLVIDLVGLLSYEYFLGLEFIRPFILMILINQTQLSRGKKYLKGLAQYLPWLLIELGYLIWRSFLVKIPTLRTPVIFSNLTAKPLQTIFGLIESMIKDIVQIIFATWYDTFNPTLFDIKIPSDAFAWILAALAFIIALTILIRLNKTGPAQESNTRSWTIQALWIGLLAVVFGAAPAWAIGRSVSAENGIWNDRMGIASMMGASLFLVALVFALVKPTRNRVVAILAVMLALATGSNFRYANEYRWSATYQTRFYNQLVWRAPSIKPNTAIMSGNELFPKMGVYPTAFAINTLYPSSSPFPSVDYWFYSIPHYFPTNYFNLDEGIEIKLEKWYVQFSSISTDSLLIYWNPMEPSCLWTLDNNDRYNPFLSDYVTEALGASNLARITNDAQHGYPPQDIFGAELGHGWCYYFEKADLAKQYQDWGSVVSLYEEATAKGYHTNFGPELTPFIYGYALSGQPDRAIEITDFSKTMAEKMNPYLCDQWENIYQLSGNSPGLTDAYEREMSDLKCGI